MISHMEKVKAYEWVLRFPSQVRCCPRGPFLLHPIQRTESRAALLGVGKMLWEWQRGVSEALEGRGSGSCLLHLGLHQEACPIATGEASPWIFPTGPWAPLVLCATHHTPPPNCVASSLCTLLMEANKLWQMASEHCRKSVSICRPGSNH